MTFDEYYRRHLSFSSKLDTESPRGIACVADAMIDEMMMDLFRTNMQPVRHTQELLSFTGPLGSHGARLKIAYCLNWITEDTYRAAVKIHKIRNTMAHDMEADSFDHESVRDHVDALKEFVGDLGGTRQGLFIQGIGYVVVTINSGGDYVTMAEMEEMEEIEEDTDEQSKKPN